ncbi:MAG: SDR family NAD(P)-dependent oxidoreductase [Ruminococcaceae bacterium]|nr:SDR family NAD(P)-dependent oxidoreductase [Oscillospiraceae bacterium]
MILPMKPDFSGKVAVVTGGAGVLCAEFCRALAECGAKVAILNRTLSKAEKLADEIKAAGGEALAVGVDVTDAQSVKAAHETVLKVYGPCDILVNGAGGNDPAATADDEFFSMDTLQNPDKKSFFDLTSESFGKVFSLNIMGTLLPTQAFAREMAEAGKGCIINISSMNAFTPLTKIPAYSAAKSGVSNFTEWLAVHFAKTGIRCNAIAPGFFSTAQNAKLLWNEDGSPTARTGKILAATPMGRFGEPQELIGALLFLCDENCSGFMTGVVLPVDGGFNAYSGV